MWAANGKKSSRADLVISVIDIYALYAKALQNPAADVGFFRYLYRELRGRNPKRLREDFCGTFGVCREWVKLGPDYRAHGRDLSGEALDYGRAHYLPTLTPSQRRRLTLARENVLTPGPAADLILAQNFSYFNFKERATLKRYFVNCRKSLRSGGVLALDIFGGPGTHTRVFERTAYPGFVYYWEQYGFDPVTHEARVAVHFKPKGSKIVRDVFTYDWRLWTIPEVRELLAEAGFKKSHVYWEGADKTGKVERIWMAMILAEK